MGDDGRNAGFSQQKVALVVEDDADQRDLIGAILEESDLRVIGCESGEAAMEIMERVGDRTVFMLADVNLAGVMDGIDLARNVSDRWPHTRLVATSGGCDQKRMRALPKDTRFMPKPWRALDLMMEVERAIAAR